jgi:hypothetical protein
LANRAVQRDGSEAQKSKSQAGLDWLIGTLGLAKEQDRRARLQRIKEITEALFAFADQVVMCLPE